MNSATAEVEKLVKQNERLDKFEELERQNEIWERAGKGLGAPLLESIQQSRFKRGDIIFITDGECRVSADWAEEFRQGKEELGFSLFSILIDVGSNSLETLKEFSDKVTTVTQLTSEGVKDLFVKL